MRTSRITPAAIVVALVVLTSLLANPPARAWASTSSKAPRPISWLAAGDSYSSGQGLTYRTGPCARAYPARAPRLGAWGPQAANALRRSGAITLAGNPVLVACTGAKTHELFAPQGKHPLEWTPAMGKFDLVSFTFGGDNINFGSAIYQCLGLSAAGGVSLLGALAADPITGLFAWAHDPFVHCPSNTALRKTIANEASHYRRFLEHVASRVVTPGGNVVVLGYPELVELPKLWLPVDRYVGLCQGIRPSDANELRGIAADLNATIAEAVKTVNAKHINNVHVTYVDVNTGTPSLGIPYNDPNLFEPNTGARHNLCAAQEWLNGITLFSRHFSANASFHPNEQGTDAMARLVVQAFPDLNWSKLGKPLSLVRTQLTAATPGMQQTIVQTPGGYEAATYDQHSHIDFWTLTGTGPWVEAARGYYPTLAYGGQGENVTVAGRLLTGMTDATFIVTGAFSGDGTGNALAYTHGPQGWGVLTNNSGNSLTVSSGTVEANPATEAGIDTHDYFTGGMLETSDNSGAFDIAFAASFPLDWYWTWSHTHFSLAKDNIVTATTAAPPTTGGSPLASDTPADGTYWAYITGASAAPTTGGTANVNLSFQPACPPDNTGCSLPASPPTGFMITAPANMLTVYPLVTGLTAQVTQTAAYITGPLWPIAGFGEVPNTFDGPSTWDGSYGQGQTPWRIPKSLDISGSQFLVGANLTAELSFTGSALTKMTVVSPFPNTTTPHGPGGNGGSGVVSTDGSVGSLKFGVSTQADVEAFAGPPQSTTGASIPGFPAYTALEYLCGVPASLWNCQTTYYLNTSTGLLEGFGTTSPNFHTSRGTTVGMSAAEAQRREDNKGSDGCQFGINLAPGTGVGAANVRIFLPSNPTGSGLVGSVTEIASAAVSGDVGNLFC
jgi:hypothetical protein